MTWSRRFILLTVPLCLLAIACVSAPRPKAGEQLYFAVEVARDGKVVARSKLLGEVGKPVRAERRQPGAAGPDYRLVLDPAQDGDAFKIKLDLAMPDGSGHSELALLHGEERRIELGDKPGDLQVSLMVMKVDSPEFRALMDLAERARYAPGSI